MQLFIVFGMTLFAATLFGDIPLFHPPEDWEFAVPKNHSPYLKVGFLGKGDSGCRPSINLAVEKIDDLTEKEYIKAVKEIHLEDKETTWRDLGKFNCQMGTGRIMEISKKTPTGDLKILQFILTHNSYAYILTGAALKADYLKEQPRFFDAFRSLSITSDLFDLLPQESKEKFVREFTLITEKGKESTKEKDLLELQKIISEHTPTLGKHWEILVLKEGLEKISQKQ